MRFLLNGGKIAVISMKDEVGSRKDEARKEAIHMKTVEKHDSSLVPAEVIENKILLLRGQKVMLSFHLAYLYGVKPKVLIQAVKRNWRRFPEDFMFQLSKEEFTILKSQFVTSNWGGLRRA